MSRDETREPLRAFLLSTGPAKDGGYLTPEHREQYLDEMEALHDALGRASWSALVARPGAWPERLRHWAEKAEDSDELFDFRRNNLFEQYKANLIRASREKREKGDASGDGDDGRAS